MTHKEYKTYLFLFRSWLLVFGLSFVDFMQYNNAVSLF